MTACNLTLDILSHPYPGPGEGVISGHEVQLSYHHVVPKAKEAGLIALWNRVLDHQDIGTVATPLLNAIGMCVDQYGTTLVADDIDSVKKIVKDIKSGATTHSAVGKRPYGWDNFAQVYIWLPGNLFTGPDKRVDDPGQALDRPARHIVKNYDELREIDEEIAKYLREPNKSAYAENAYKKLGALGRDYKAIQAFNAAQWVWDNGKGGPKVKGS